MNFLNNYKSGGDRADKTGKMGGYVYLSKRHEQDLVLELRKAFIKVSENPKHPGKEKGIFVFRVNEINSSGQTAENLGDDEKTTAIEVGDEVSIMIDLQPSNDMAVEPAVNEFLTILAACTRVSVRDYWKSLNNVGADGQSLPEAHLEDDASAFEGNLVHVTTPEKPNKGWYNLEFAPVGSAKGKKAKKAS